MPLKRHYCVPPDARDRLDYIRPLRRLNPENNRFYYDYEHLVCGARHRYDDCPKRRNNMDESNVIQERMKTLQLQIDRNADELALLSKFPNEDEFKDGTVIRWTRDDGNRKYQYFAAKDGEYWYFTIGGPSGANSFDTVLRCLTDYHGALVSLEVTKKNGWKDLLG